MGFRSSMQNFSLSKTVYRITLGEGGRAIVEQIYGFATKKVEADQPFSGMSTFFGAADINFFR